MTNKAGFSGGKFLAGVIAGGAFVYLFDPDKCGHRRRVLARDKALRAEHVLGHFADKAVRDFQNRARGVLAEAWATVREGEVPDDVLLQRVSARIGRAVSHPRALHIELRNGIVRVSGPILESEVQTVLQTLRAVRGVRDVENHLEPHRTAENVPALQGGSRREPRPELLQERWAPATRALVGLSGLGLLSLANGKRKLRLPLGVAGGALLVRALTNMPLSKALGLAETPDVIQLRKTIHINAPVDELYQLFANPENFPRIFEHVTEVRHSRDNLYYWTVVGPAGMPVSWESVVTEAVTNERIAWTSVPSAAVRTSGWVQFQPDQGAGTTVNIQFTYKPPAGVIGHLIASLFGADPKHALDDDIARLKSLFETGKTTVHHHPLRKDEVEREIKACEERSKAAGKT
ncbi:MAG: hypothetical protein C5B58_04820 [Acidobacteria bacterium]|nr:MAG: hypothetical protein C5B58_04820 [Acidobacteriota bacterium]